MYTVTLAVLDDDGGLGGDILHVFVTNVAPAVEAGPDQATEEGSTVNFHGTFTGTGTLDRYAIIWDFGDGITASGTLTPAHVYTENGAYTVTLTISDDDGLVGSDMLRVSVSNIAPTVHAGPNQTAIEGSPVQFSGAFTDPGVLDTHAIWWNFGDGVLSVDALTPTHIYADNGTYTVTLIVIDDDGGIGADSLLVTVNNANPVVDAGPDRSSTEGATVHFHGAFTDPGTLDTHTIAWTFGDGATSSGTLTPDHVYADNGVYTATLTVTDKDGGVGVDMVAITVANVAPSVDAGADITATEGAAIHFNGAFTDPGTLDAHTIEWQFGDGSAATGSLTPQHTYVDNGTYTVTLTITDKDGGVGGDTLVVTINNVAPAVDAGPNAASAEGSSLNFNGAFTDPGVLDTHTIQWTFGDGTSSTGTLTPAHTYTDNGAYTVTLTVTDKDGGVGIDTLIVTVSNVAPVVNAGPDRAAVKDAIVNFNGSFVDPGILDTHTIQWQFGDGTVANATLAPTHVYTRSGVFTVTLTVTDDDGGIGNDTLHVTVSDETPTLACLHASDSLNLRDRTVISFTNVFGGKYFELGADARVYGDVIVDGNAFLRSRARIDGDLTLAGTLQQQDNVVIVGVLMQGATVSAPTIPTKTVTFGATSLTVENGQNAIWAPGSYRDGMVRARGSVVLSAGTYHFRTLIIEPDADVILDTSAGAITINVAEALEFGDRSEISAADGDKVTFYTNATGTVRIGTDVVFNGHIVAPYASVQAFSRTAINGCLAGKTITIEPDTRLQPPTSTAPSALYPIALHRSSIQSVLVGQALPDVYNGAEQGNFGWLSWTGANSEPVLVQSLTPPGNSQTYVNPNNSSDHILSIGDWVYGRPGVANSKSVRDALDVLKALIISVPVWDTATGQGNNTQYHIVGCARLRITAYQLPGQDRISASYGGIVACP